MTTLTDNRLRGGEAALAEEGLLLPAGAVESAALALVPEEAGYMLSRGNGGWHLASFVLPGLDEEITAEGPTMALALIGAMAGALRAALQCGVLSAYPPAGSRVN
jgi:hypothetical protein